MRTNPSRESIGYFRFLAVAAVLAVGALTAFPTSALSAMAMTIRQSTGSGAKAASHPATLGITLEEAPFVPGQPVIATVRVTNASDRELSGMEFAYYEYSGGWLRFEVRDDAGNVMRRDTRTTRMDGYDPLPEPPRPDGLTIVAIDGGTHPLPATLLPGKSKAWRFVFPPAMIPDRPGRYSLVARAILPTGGEGSAKSALPELRLPLVIGEYDRGRLRTLAEKLRAAAFGPGNGFSALDLDALMAFPPASVRSVWRGLALDPNLSGPSRNTLVSWLVRQGSSEARGILREMREREPPGSDLRTRIDHQLKVLAWRAGEKVEW